jgi:hypothetical protein
VPVVVLTKVEKRREEKRREEKRRESCGRSFACFFVSECR